MFTQRLAYSMQVDFQKILDDAGGHIGGLNNLKSLCRLYEHLFVWRISCLICKMLANEGRSLPLDANVLSFKVPPNNWDHHCILGHLKIRFVSNDHGYFRLQTIYHLKLLPWMSKRKLEFFCPGETQQTFFQGTAVCCLVGVLRSWEARLLVFKASIDSTSGVCVKTLVGFEVLNIFF